jgi:hypothetical protein
MGRGFERTPLRTFPKRIEAACYNHARLALNRWGEPLRLALPRHRGLDAILVRDRWLCVEAGDDIPMLAWCGFCARGRSSLHTPVECRLELYHIRAGLIMGTALDALNEGLRARLAPDHGESDAAG